MMPLELFKRFAPFLAVAVIAALIWTDGYFTAEKRWIEKSAAQRAANDTVVNEQVRKNLDTEQKLNDVKQEIQNAYDTHQKKLGSLSARNRQLLADRMRDKGCGDTVSQDTGPASGGAEGASRVWVVQQGIAEGLVERQSKADDILEVARSCQAYVRSIVGELK